MFDHCLYFNTTALARRLEREWAEAFECFELTPPQGFMLRAVLERPGSLQRELADLLFIARPTATRVLDGLEARGYVERQRTEGDGREVAIVPTAQALAIREALNAASAAVTSRLKRTLGGEAFGNTVSRLRTARATLG
ncbi:MarR family winged helix-turn-helix transcriptional regulator [Paraburkholderia lycopersici]|uniref:DNA-binding transcriptional regulator, MarR family n=1 Tax=Paraburkholderia lycopersici TaxID=416944 RepID=A0A1G7CVS9_9BURK|nr:MarR family transcriptional regulator [Paraburkholderia lycopersici]SDE43353.1 DNA-binding transcriptional regulator, MarR family [Paraburkholderia lycopersici]